MSDADANSSNTPPQTWTQAQQAIQDQQLARERAAQAAAEAAFRAARDKPATVAGTTSPSATIKAVNNQLGSPSLPTPQAGAKPKARKGK
jgi:hypothetical protein